MSSPVADPDPTPVDPNAPAVVVNCGTAGGQQLTTVAAIPTAVASFDTQNDQADAQALVDFQAQQASATAAAQQAATIAAQQASATADLQNQLQQMVASGQVHPAIVALAKLTGAIPT